MPISSFFRSKSGVCRDVSKNGKRVTLIYAQEQGQKPAGFEPGENEHKFVFEQSGEKARD